jgi:hypothetical protein
MSIRKQESEFTLSGFNQKGILDKKTGLWVDTKPYHIDEKEGLPSTQRILIKTLEKEIQEKNTYI